MSAPDTNLEARSLRRAALCLLVLSALRWGWEVRGARAPGGDGAPGASVRDSLAHRTERAADDAERRARPLGPGERIDPNVASAVELDRLPGVGPSTAEALVEAREAGAVFRRPDDLSAVRGIGPATVARLARHLEFTGASVGRRSAVPGGPRRAGSARLHPVRRPGTAGTPIDLNRADEATLQALPGIGPALARRIVKERGRGPFRRLEDLTRVSGIGPRSVERLRGLATARPRQ